MGTDDQAKTVTIRGRLSFPNFTAQEAYDLSLKGNYPNKSVGESKPHFQLIVEQDQLDRLMNKAVDEFLPNCVARHNAGEKKDSLEQSEVDDILAQLANPAKWDKGAYNTPFKTVHEKTAALAPEGQATIKVIGNPGQDFVLMAVVMDESELIVPDENVLKYPIMRPINETKHQMYPGAIVAVTLNLYAYRNGRTPGFSAGATTAVFRADADRFGGGVSVDEDAIFMD